MGVWIEIADKFVDEVCGRVTPCVGVWIEILFQTVCIWQIPVTPCVGVWIEIITVLLIETHGVCHSLRGSVD